METNEEESDDITDYYRSITGQDRRKGEDCDRSRGKTIESGN